MVGCETVGLLVQDLSSLDKLMVLVQKTVPDAKIKVDLEESFPD